ncbi:hypothetical protein [Streptomyces sp. ML-6]|uniref:hypothetical protein n=1 Tax=Streptomyces sp. ML-6 TaxID=2982693 RepID=UPI0024BF76D4|nr:hypothetical protein [Streptomyces sp. ML-6]MDK0520620.1 hypothetical protein [Streptomyces sp. ML-6]
MSEENTAASQQEPPQVPLLGTLLVDTGHRNRAGEFRGVSGPYWSLRPVCGGTEWEAEPVNVRAAEPIERLRAETARCNARSAGRIL